MTGGCEWHRMKGLGSNLVWLRERKAEDQCGTNIQLIRDGKGRALEQVALWGSSHPW